jgi:two-component system chemotaxis response regulator CheB
LSSLRGQPSTFELLPSATPHIPAFDVVVIGASAGGLAALATLLEGLPASFPVGLALVLHLSRHHPSVLTGVLARHTPLHVGWAHEGELLHAGHLFVAPPDHHLVVQAGGTLSLVDSPPVRHSRPAVDPLFASAADVFGPRALAVILSGSGTDGTAGALAVHRAGGVVIAQDEASSEYFGMPGEAIESGGVTHVLPLDVIATALHRLVTLGVAAAFTGWPPDRAGPAQSS